MSRGYANFTARILRVTARSSVPCNFNWNRIILLTVWQRTITGRLRTRNVVTRDASTRFIIVSNNEMININRFAPLLLDTSIVSSIPIESSLRLFRCYSYSLCISLLRRKKERDIQLFQIIPHFTRIFNLPPKIYAIVSWINHEKLTMETLIIIDTPFLFTRQRRHRAYIGIV